MKVFLNDKLFDSGRAHVAVNDSGLLYGAGLFETMRVCNGVVFALDEHLNRLFSSAKALSIVHDYEKEFITESIYRLLKANKLTEARVRLTLTAGAMAGDAETPKATLLITAVKFTPYPAEYYKKGVLVILCPFKQNPMEPTCGHKTTSYFSRMLGLKLAHEKKAAEAIWFTVDNRLAEGCISNVFLVKDSVLYTPSLDTPVLGGIARKTVCEIAKENSIALVEKMLTIDDVLGADDIFMTNVIMQVMPIVQVEKHTVKDGRCGEVTKKLIEKYNEFLKAQCKKTK